MNLRLLHAALTAVGAGLVVTGCAVDPASPTAGDFACAALVDVDGHRYVGHGVLVRTPATTGRTRAGVVPGCDDGGGEPVGPADVMVDELADVPLSQAVLVDDMLYVREGEPVPEAARAWFEEPRCDEAGAFDVTGHWLAVDTTHRPRFDGDLRAPYDLTVRVTRGPEAYVGSTVTIRATRSTQPALAPKDVKQSLWRGGDVTGTVHCEEGRFVADALAT